MCTARNAAGSDRIRATLIFQITRVPEYEPSPSITQRLHTWVGLTGCHAFVQVVAGTNYDLVFTTYLNCTSSPDEAPITLEAKVFQPLPYTNSPPQVSTMCSTAVRHGLLSMSMHSAGQHTLSGERMHQLSSGSCKQMRKPLDVSQVQSVNIYKDQTQSSPSAEDGMLL